MQKKVAAVLLLFLCGCSRQQTIRCSLGTDEKQRILTIEASNDTITGIRVRESFLLPYDLLLNKERRHDLEKQLDDTYHFEGNELIREYDLDPDDVYSLQMTINELKKERYNCE